MKKILSIIFTLSLFLPYSASASVFSVSATQNAGVGDEFVATVYLDTEGQRINAVSGSFSVNSAVTILEVREQGTAVTLWVEKPTLVGNKVTFSGIIPGGVQGDKVLVFNVVVKARSEGRGELGLLELLALKNDGDGSSDKTTSQKAFIAIGPAKSTPSHVSEIDDITPPADFTPIISRSTELFDNKWFVSFATQDKGTGVSHYEVSERTFPWQKESWNESPSPHVLKSQKKWSFVAVKALDGRGNERVVSIAPEGGIFHYPNYVISIIIILILLAVYLIKFYKKWRKSGRQN